MRSNQPELWPNAVEELLRFDTSVRNVGRGTTVREVHRSAISHDPRRERTSSINLGAANRDSAPLRTDPNELLLDREDPAPLSFAHGPHYCVGAALARMETPGRAEAPSSRRMGDYTVDESTASSGTSRSCFVAPRR